MQARQSAIAVIGPLKESRMSMMACSYSGAGYILIMDRYIMVRIIT
jgi:hypothetical protein